MYGIRGVLYLVGAITLCACSASDDSNDHDIDMSFRDGDGSVLAPGGRPSGGTWINNGLYAPDLGGVDPAHPLTGMGLSDALGLLADPAKLGIAEYLVECALPPGSTVTKEVDGETIELHGLVGLTPEWEDGDCDEDCQQWISACMLARTNVAELTVQIWIQGDHPVLGEGVPEGALFEAGFYGNLFADPDAQYYCEGSKEGIVAAKREGRTCTSNDGQACGFTTFSQCSERTRCDEVGSDGNVPANCRAKGPETFRTIATYIVP